MNLKNALVSAVVALLVVVVGFAFFGPKESSIVVKVLEQVKALLPLGAIPGSHIEGPCMDLNGVQRCAYRVSYSAATTSPCSIRSPATATSSLINWSVTNITATSVASVLSVAQSANSNNSTSTLLVSDLSISANAKIATSSNAFAALIAPNTWINFGIKGGNGTNSSANGFCQATFETY